MKFLRYLLTFLFPLIIIYLCSWNLGICQINQYESGLDAQLYSKEITEYRVKEFIIKEILNLPEKQTIEIQISSITASKSGELTTVIYECKSLNKRGLIFGFWNERINEYNTTY